MKRKSYKVSGLNLIRKLLRLIKDGHRLYHVVKGDSDLSFQTDESLDSEVKKTFSHIFDKSTPSHQIRLSIIIPIIICTIVLVVASLFVYDIEVYGYDASIVKEVVGVENYKGVYKGNIDTQAIEDSIYHALKVSVVDVRMIGTKLRITCKAQLDDEQILDISKDTPLYSNGKGVVSRVVVLAGTPLVKVGEVVGEGETLIDTYQLVNGIREDSQAIGAVYAKVYHTTRVVLTRYELVPVRTGEVEEFSTLRIGYDTSVPPSSYDNYELVKVILPIGDLLPIYKVTYYYYATTYTSTPNPRYEDYHDLVTIAYQQLEEESEGEMILNRWYIVTDVGDYRYVDVYLECEKQICSNLG